MKESTKEKIKSILDSLTEDNKKDWFKKFKKIIELVDKWDKKIYCCESKHLLDKEEDIPWHCINC